MESVELSRRSLRISSILSRVNVPSEDDGRKFVITDRVDAIRNLLSISRYQLLYNGDLSLVYSRDDFTTTDGFILISCHIDSIYSTHFCSDFSSDEIIGTLDNSICNAILIELMHQEGLPSNVLVAFTGDEEGDFHGADDVMAFVQREFGDLRNLELAITLDVTSEAYTTHHYTVENLLVGHSGSKLTFDDKYQFGGYIKECLQDADCHLVFDADQDESIRYNEYGLTCISLCIPTHPHPDNSDCSVGFWMHNDKGILVRKQATVGFAGALEQLCQSISRNLTSVN